MNSPNCIDFQFLRCGHGWSKASLYINNNCHNFFLTHIYNDPLAAICSATITLAKGYDAASFSWFDEPGQYDWRLTKNASNPCLINASIYVYSSNTDGRNREGSTFLLDKEITFQVELDFWIDLVTLEAQKIAKLMTYKHYAEGRDAHNFPWQELKQLKQYCDR